MRKRTAVQGLLVTATALVAAAAGVGGTLLYQRITAPDTAAVDAQAAALAQDLRQDLTAGFYSAGGGTYGGQFTEGTIVAQVEEHGGALLSIDADGALGHTAEVMLGLVPPTGTTVSARAYPVRCYRFTFARGAFSVKHADMTCPNTQADGRPGSLAAQMGGLLARQPATASAYRKMSAAGYDHTTDGATRFLTDKRLVSAKDTVTDLSGREAGTGVYAVALRVNGVCHYMRMDSGSAAAGLVPLWTAPADEQHTCRAQQAVTASALYGSDPAKEG
ncbi:hypothetical protein [Streptomyces sp. Root369]|uniref:hypothetical protein n=1 Tax=Streptomyces sp. Root369 TaxID=1736523 RepID=UPI00070AB496|nr:hypothetical protein [Streptomyces sp. Root369]KQW17864.1 hypothetical protein ASD08_02465 [Streptomyces sp. Root369]